MRTEKEAKEVLMLIEGMHCIACARNLEKALKKEQGIIWVKVDFLTGKARVKYDPLLTNLSGIVEIIKKLGHKVKIEEENLTELNEIRLRVFLAWIFTLLIIIWMLYTILAKSPWPSKLIYKA